MSVRFRGEFLIKNKYSIVGYNRSKHLLDSDTIVANSVPAKTD